MYRKGLLLTQAEGVATVARAILFASISAMLAFSIANTAPQYISPTIAAVLSLSAIKTSLNDTVRETVKQIAGSFFGAALGIILVQFIGFNVASLAVIVVISMLVAFVIRLQIPGGLAIAATAILVSGPLFGDFQSIEQRVAGVLVGTLCAFLASWFMVPWSPTKRLLNQSSTYGEALVKLMDDIVRTYKKAAPLKANQVETWLETVEGIESDLRASRYEAEQLTRDSKWTPFVKRSLAEQVFEQLSLMKSNTSALKTIVLAMENAVEHGVVLNESSAKRIAKLLQVSRNGIYEQLQMAKLTPGARVPEEVEETIRSRRSKLAGEITNMTDTRAIMLGGTLMHETTKIKDLISGKNV